jgi:hypothetical protein
MIAIKAAVRRMPLGQALTYLTEVGLESDCEKTFEFCERVRWVLCESDRRKASEEVARLDGAQKGADVCKEGGRDAMDGEEL